MTVAEWFDAERAILNAFISVGDDVPEMMDWVRKIQDDLVGLSKVVMRHVPKAKAEFSAPNPDEAPDDVKALRAQVEEKFVEAAGPGKAAINWQFWQTLIQSLVQQAITNPAFLPWLISILTKPA